MEVLTHKGEGFMHICKELDVRVQESIDFYDGHNIKEFIACAGLGVAMKNSMDMMKFVADVES